MDEYYLLVDKDKIEGPFDSTALFHEATGGGILYSRKELRKMGYDNARLEAALKGAAKKSKKVEKEEASFEWSDGTEHEPIGYGP